MKARLGDAPSNGPPRKPGTSSTQVFQNLLENACNTAPSGGRPFGRGSNVYEDSMHDDRRDAGRWNVTIRDYGPSIAVRAHPR